ncbi:MAG TPA: uroporphyrinogen decarboxylase family protein [Armatimonadota bacterium]
MESMTSKERIIVALHGQPTDRVPWSPFLAYIWEHLPQEIQTRGQVAFLREVGADPLWRGAPCAVVAETPGAELLTTEDGEHVRYRLETPVGTLNWARRVSAEGNTHFLNEHPLKTAEDFKVQLWVEEHTRFRQDLTAAHTHLAQDGQEGLSIGMLIPRGKTAFQQLIEFYVGTEELAYALVDYPEIVDELVQTMAAKNLEAVRLAVDAPYDYFLTYEDSSTQNYSPMQYAAYIAPEIQQYCAILATQQKYYIQHACGHVQAILPTMMESGIFAVESLSPLPTGNLSLRAARQMVGSKVGIIGGIEPVHFLTMALAELPAYVAQVIADAAGGPFVLANSDSCPPGVTVEKFKSVGRTVRELAGLPTTF